MQTLAHLLMARNERTAPPPGANYGALAGPQALGAAQAPPAPPAMPPTQTASVPPAIAPGDQTVPAMPPPTQIGPNTPGFWERINKALAAQQIPDGYRGAMGEMIKNG
jgi:hypothetical protein